MGQGRLGLVLVTLALVPPVALADFVEVVPKTATVDVPRASVGSTTVLFPHLVSYQECFQLGVGFLCLDLVRMQGFRQQEVPYPVITYEEKPIPFAEVHVWSPLAMTVTCGTAASNANARHVTAATRTDLTGSHAYFPLRTYTEETPPNFAAAAAFDVVCKRVDGEGVPEQLLP